MRLGATEARHNKQDEQRVRREALETVLQAIPADHPSGRSASLISRQRARLEYYALAAQRDAPAPATVETAIDMQLLDVEREFVAHAYEENRLTDEARRRIERELDLEDARLRHAGASANLGSDNA